jgi:hypothetical protein
MPGLFTRALLAPAKVGDYIGTTTPSRLTKNREILRFAYAKFFIGDYWCALAASSPFHR